MGEWLYYTTFPLEVFTQRNFVADCIIAAAKFTLFENLFRVFPLPFPYVFKNCELGNSLSCKLEMGGQRYLTSFGT